MNAARRVVVLRDCPQPTPRSDQPSTFCALLRCVVLLVMGCLSILDPGPCDGSANADVGLVLSTWGWNEDGQCNVPAPNEGFLAASGGSRHTLGLKFDGTVVAWGGNLHGQCDIPASNNGFVAVAAGYWHSLALREDGSVVGWGYNLYGQCDAPAPNMDFIAIEGGGDHSLGLKADGTIVAWGSNAAGQCNVPEPNTGFVAVAAGYSHSLGLKADGSIMAWGSNLEDQCNVPIPNTGYVAIAAGYYHCLALRSDGTIAAWGSNDHGQCNIPAPNTSFVGIAGGFYHSFALYDSGSIVAWGGNNVGQCDLPEPNSDYVTITSGAGHGLGLRGASIGACCRIDGACTVSMPADCLSPDIWMGPATTCYPNPCLMGACCLHSYCLMSTESECSDYGGTYEGNATSCDLNPCPTSTVDGETSGLPLPPAHPIPNPSTGNASFALKLSSATTITLEIFNTAGVLVRHQTDGLQPPGFRTIVWDGRDEEGHRLPSGVYLARITTAEGVTTGRVVIAQ